MSSGRRARLSRLARVVRIIYRQEAAELTRRQLELRTAGEIVASTERQLEAPLVEGAFLSQLAIARAAKARQQLTAAHAQVRAQLSVTLDAVGKKKGVEGESDAYAHELERERSLRDADDVLERVCRPQKTSPG